MRPFFLTVVDSKHRSPLIIPRPDRFILTYRLEINHENTDHNY